MKKVYCFILVMVLFLTACGNNQKTNSDVNIEPVKVDIQIEPEPISVNKLVTIKAVVTQGSEKVDDAKEVKFEIWKEGQENHDITNGKHQKDCIYLIEKSFKEPGVYYVISHVTARDMHTMPKKKFVVNDK